MRLPIFGGDIPLRKNSNKMSALIPELNLSGVEKFGGFNTERCDMSNVFGYTPYDTGKVHSGFTDMMTSIPLQSSLLNSLERKPAKKRAPNSKSSTLKSKRKKDSMTKLVFPY
jgi:hypothetical protein